MTRRTCTGGFKNCIENIRKPVLLVVYDKRDVHVHTLLESIDEFMGTDKKEFINIAFLLEDASIEVIYIKLPEIRAFELMDF
jgi:hypothetical protein